MADQGEKGWVRSGSADLKAMRQPDGDVWYWSGNGWTRAVPDGSIAQSFTPGR